MSLELVESVDRMAPFGPGNPPLTFAARNLQIATATPVGKSGEHLQVTVEDQDHRQAKVIWWNGAGSPSLKASSTSPLPPVPATIAAN